MIALLLALLADPPASIDDLPIGGLAPQALPTRGCAAYLFTGGATRALAAMEPGAAIFLLVETQVREDAITLFGFASTAEREWFRLLPQAALSAVCRT